MFARSKMTHFETFARLHRGGPADIASVKSFCERLVNAHGRAQPDWASVLHSEDAYVLVATECQVVVGVGIVKHTTSAAQSTLSWLLVSQDARGRGVGQLIVETLIHRARSQGAAILRAQLGDAISEIDRLLLKSGFVEMGGGEWVFGLWNAHQATSYGRLSLPIHEPVTVANAISQTLLIAMGALDDSMFLTERARQVIDHELSIDIGTMPELGRIAAAASVRRYIVRLAASIATELRTRSLPDIAERICEVLEPLTPEGIIGNLSQQKVCMIRICLNRTVFNGARWLIITGFDGFLFRLHDVTRRQEKLPIVITVNEMRDALASENSTNFVVISKAI